MANKIVILKKGETTGLEFPLDVHTGTDLRDVCYEGGNQFWITRDPNTVHHYRLDPLASTMRKLTSDDITLTGGTTTDIYGMATDGQKLFHNSHNLRAGTHNNSLITGGKSGTQLLVFNQDSGAGDSGNRLKGMDYIGDRLAYLYQSSVGNTSLRVIRFTSTAPSTINQIGLGATGFVGVCFEKQGGEFWVLNSSGVLSLIDISGNFIENFTIGNSGTVRGLCDLLDGRLAISMT